MKQYAERDIWGTLKPATDIHSGLEENMRFTTYRFDPVIGKHFALARFYDGANGRMMSKDPVKRGLNQYCYCDNDPVNYEDSTGEVLHILGAAGLGGLLGAGGAALDSIASQILSGEKIDWRKVGGSAIEGGINGAAQAGLIASGAGIPAALLVDFLAGTTGSAAKQYFVDGKVDVGESLFKGVTNAIGQLPHNDKLFNKLGKLGKLKGLGREATKGAMSGAGEAGARYIFDHIGTNPEQARMGTGLLPAVDMNLLPDGLLSDPKRGCGGESSFTLGLGYSSARGYRYKTPDISESKSNKASLGGFLKETALGGLMGGLSSAAFYRVDKGLDKLIDSVLPKKNRIEPDFYVGPNGKALPSQYKDWIGTNKQKELLGQAENPQLQNAIKQLYRGNSFIGNGGTADVIRFEKQTGLMLGKNGGSHIQKGMDMTKYIENKILSQGLSPSDRVLSTQLLEELYSALGR